MVTATLPSAWAPAPPKPNKSANKYALVAVAANFAQVMRPLNFTCSLLLKQHCVKCILRSESETSEAAQDTNCQVHSPHKDVDATGFGECLGMRSRVTVLCSESLGLGYRAHTKGVVLSEKACFYLLNAFSKAPFLEPPLRTSLRTPPPSKTHRTTPSKNSSWNSRK